MTKLNNLDRNPVEFKINYSLQARKGFQNIEIVSRLMTIDYCYVEALQRILYLSFDQKNKK